MHAMIAILILPLLRRLRSNAGRTVALKKVINDLKLYPGRTFLVFFAQTVGLWGVGSILVSYTVLRNDLNENFLRTIPAQVEMTSDDFAKLDIATFRKRGDIEAAEFRDLSIERIEAFPDKWLPLLIFGVEDFDHMQVARFYPQKGKSIPDAGSLLIERDAQNPIVSNLDIGKNARIRVQGKIASVPITGITFDPAQAPATQDAFVYAYTDKKTYNMLTGQMPNQRLIFRFRYARTGDEIQSKAQSLVEEFEKAGILVKTLNVPKFNEHPHQFQLNTLLLTNGIIGLLAFIMGAILVSQLVSAILARQIRQIGILKAIGASRIKIVKMYLLMILIPGVFSSIVAVPLAILSGYAYAGFVAKIINFEILTTSLPHGILFTLLLTGLLLPIVFCIPALRRGTAVSVRDALSDYGLGNQGEAKQQEIAAAQGRSFGASWLLEVLPLGVRLAVRNTMRRKRRFLATILSMALGVAIFDTGFNVRQSLADFLAQNRDSMKHDVQVVLREPTEKEKALLPFAKIAAIETVEVWNGGKGALQTQIASTLNRVGIIALPFDTNLMTWEMIAGRWLGKPRRMGGDSPVEIVMNQQALDTFHITTTDVGRTLPLQFKNGPVQGKLVGIVKEFDKPKIYIDKEDYDRLVNPEHLANSLMFVSKRKDYDAVIDLKKEIERAIASSDLDVLYVMSQAERAKIIYEHLNIILTVLTFLALLVLFVSALGMASTAGINILERSREIGVLRAIGGQKNDIYRLFVTEGLVVSGLSVAAGMLLALPLSLLSARYFGYLILGAHTPLGLSFSGLGFAITLALTLSFGWLASRIPANSAIKVPVREALAYE